MTILAVAAPSQSTGDTTGYTLLVATDGAQVRAAQRLRYRVFAEELGATLHGVDEDVDEFDAFCDHLIIREERTGDVVGTYRMLPPDRAARAGRLYSEGEFDLAGLAPLRDALVETGRSCVHPDHRTGAVINLMWAGIARYMHLHGYRWLGGWAPVPPRRRRGDAAGGLGRPRGCLPPWLGRRRPPPGFCRLGCPGGRCCPPSPGTASPERSRSSPERCSRRSGCATARAGACRAGTRCWSPTTCRGSTSW